MFEAVKAAGGGPDIYGSECTAFKQLWYKNSYLELFKPSYF
jgi:hypothetical protein